MCIQYKTIIYTMEIVTETVVGKNVTEITEVIILFTFPCDAKASCSEWSPKQWSEKM